MTYENCLHFAVCDRCPNCKPEECEFFTDKNNLVEIVRCKDCKHWHSNINWCDRHSHFIGDDGEACHPSQSPNWKMFDENDFCSYGIQKDDTEDSILYKDGNNE